MTTGYTGPSPLKICFFFFPLSIDSFFPFLSPNRIPGGSTTANPSTRQAGSRSDLYVRSLSPSSVQPSASEFKVHVRCAICAKIHQIHERPSPKVELSNSVFAYTACRLMYSATTKRAVHCKYIYSIFYLKSL